MQFKANLLLVLGFSFEAAANSGWSSSCNSHGISAPISNDPVYELHANCAKRTGDYNVDIVVNIDSCFANNNGALIGQLNGNFGKTCRNVGIGGSSSIITAQCKNIAGSWISTSIDSNDWIGNLDGTLWCFNQNGH